MKRANHLMLIVDAVLAGASSARPAAIASDSVTTSGILERLDDTYGVMPPSAVTS